jgi:hypothetical protein
VSSTIRHALPVHVGNTLALSCSSGRVVSDRAPSLLVSCVRVADMRVMRYHLACGSVSVPPA